jgi:propanediol dehydratase small subunit
MRIMGLLEALKPYCVPRKKLLNFWHLLPEYEKEARALVQFWKDMRKVYSEKKLKKFLQKAEQLDSKDVRMFFRDLRCHVALSRGSL